MIHVLAFIGLLWVVSTFVLGVAVFCFWLYDRSYQRRAVELPKATVRR